MVRFCVCLTAGLITGCLQTPAPPPLRPVLACEDCKGLTYYGPQQAPPPNPNVQMASILTKGVMGVTGYIVGGAVAKTVAQELASGAAGNIQTTNTVERTEIERDNRSVEIQQDHRSVEQYTVISDNTATSNTHTTNTHEQTPIFIELN